MDQFDLKSIRLVLGWTQSEMARVIGVSRVYFGLMERGKKPITQRTAAAVNAAPPKGLQIQSREADPLFRSFEDALIGSGLKFRVGEATEFDLMEYEILGTEFTIQLSRYEKEVVSQNIKKGQQGIFIMGTRAIELFRDLIKFSGARALALLAS